jgi:hypothetical protein
VSYYFLNTFEYAFPRGTDPEMFVVSVTRRSRAYWYISGAVRLCSSRIEAEDNA